MAVQVNRSMRLGSREDKAMTAPVLANAVGDKPGVSSLPENPLHYQGLGKSSNSSIDCKQTKGGGGNIESLLQQYLPHLNLLFVCLFMPIGAPTTLSYGF